MDSEAVGVVLQLAWYKAVIGNEDVINALAW
jgi:hypothetical protein